MFEYTLEIELQSDTTFGMGAGVSGYVDAEIQHDDRGLPTLSGRAVKGLLVNECSEILYVLPEGKKEDWEFAAQKLFGMRGETLDDNNGLFISDGTIAPDLVAMISPDAKLSRQDVINSLTDIRRQTAMNENGAPLDETLRAMRVLVRGLTFYVPIILPDDLEEREKALLAACVMSLRRAGIGRTRGKGKIQARITDRPLAPKEFAETEALSKNDLTLKWFEFFKQEVKQ